MEKIENFLQKLSKEIGDVEMKFSFATTEGRAKQSDRFEKESIGETEVQKVLKILYEKKLNVMTKFEPNIVVKNCGYGEVIAISSDGNIYPCSILKYSMGNIRNNNLSEVIKSILSHSYNSNVDFMEGCPSCDLKYICFGGCRLNNIKYNHDLLKPYCPAEKKDDIYKKLVSRDNFDSLALWLMNN